MESANAQRILAAGRNCWRTAHAHRAAVLVDAAAYFDALAQAIERAQRSIIMVGWDMDSRVQLRPGERDACEFGRFLDRVVAGRPDLHAYLLTWDYSVIFTFEREPLPTVKLGLRTHPRIHFRLDDTHPPGASHHQKIVVIDDRIAFVGGLDIAVRRWDTSAHRADDPRRVDPAGEPYGPFHDVQMLVDGECASALGELVRARWRRATGETLHPVKVGRDPWPPSVASDIEDVSIAIARTEPSYAGAAGVREVERLYLDSIAAAHDTIYIENQYLTSATIADALAARLREPDGPEIVIVLPVNTPGWIQEQTMGVLRGHLLQRMRRADRYARLRLFYPTVPGPSTDCVKVHAKVFVVDDRFVRIGSSNLNNRSMGLDTECDLALEAGGDARIATAIGGIRNRLLGEHLGCGARTMAARHGEIGSLARAIDTLRRGERTLTPFRHEQLEPADALITDPALLDPIEPMVPERMIAELVPDDVRARMERRVARNMALLLGLLLLASAWVWTPLHAALDLDRLAGWIAGASQSPGAPLVVLSAYVIGGLVAFPVTLLIVATALSFGPLTTVLYALLGSLLSALLTYHIGRNIGPAALDRLLGPRWQAWSGRLVRRGLITMIALHLVPVAPFTVVNLAAGALNIRLRDLIWGLGIGMVPGIVATSLFTDRLADAILNPSMRSFSIFTALATLLFASTLSLRRWLAGHHLVRPTSLKGQQAR